MDANSLDVPDVPEKTNTSLNYIGNISFHRVYAPSMLQWLINTVKLLNRSSLIHCSIILDQDGIIIKKEDMNLIDFSNFQSSEDGKTEKSLDPLAFEFSSSVPNGDISNVSNCESNLLKVDFDQVVEVVLPTNTEAEKSYISMIVNYGHGSNFTMHVFHHSDLRIVNEFGKSIKKFLTWHEKHSRLSGLPSKNVKNEDLDSVRFEVMLLGKLQLTNELPSQLNFIDEAVKKYNSLEVEHAAAKEELKLIQNLSKDLTEVNINDSSTSNLAQSNFSYLIDGSRIGAENILRMGNLSNNRRPSFDDVCQQRCNTAAATVLRQRSSRTRHCSEPSTAATMGFDKNKTRIFQVGKQLVTLISPDHSARNVEIPFSIIARCSKGIKQSSHFGIFANDNSPRLHSEHNMKSSHKFKCFLFKCADGSVCDEIMQAIKQACSTCVHGADPMTSYHSLCKRINMASGSGSLLNKVEKGNQLTARCIVEVFNDAEQKRLKSKIEETCRDQQPESPYEKLVIIMDIIRLAFEERQLEHDANVKQIRDPQAGNTVSKGLTLIRSRAKKSLNSIESIWGKGLQKMHELQHEAENHIQSPVERFRFFADNARSAPSTPAAHNQSTGTSRVRHHSESPASMLGEGVMGDGGKANQLLDASRPRANTLGSPSQSSINVRRKLNLNGSTSEDDPSHHERVARSKMPLMQSSPVHSEHSSPPSHGTPEKCASCSEKTLTVRQKIFRRVATPRSNKSSLQPNESPFLNRLATNSAASPLKTPEQVRLAWRRAIRDQITLNKIEKLSAINEDLDPLSDPLRCKLNYVEVGDCHDEMCSVWEELIETDKRTRYKMDETVLYAAVKKGVPARLRGKVWTLLYEQWNLRQKRSNQSAFSLPKTSFKSLLKRLTTHQHAILIDIGRTFPTHPYFNKQLCEGQLALYNVLKAYSLADQDVGYCQGLSFVAGFILLHTPSADDAFSIFCHLMADMNCRKLYLPDMCAVHVAVYQLSRLLHDFHRDLHIHFEENEVSLMLFTTPWLLTMFASVLSPGFTARVFDLLFLEGLTALFKAAICLLGFHKQNLLMEEGFENIVSYLKENLPKMTNFQVLQVLNDVFSIDIHDMLVVYEAEYTVLEDENAAYEESQSVAANSAQELELKLNRLQQAHQSVAKYNLDLQEQLEAARMQISSLQQGLTDMADMDEKRSLQLDKLRSENETLKRRQGL